MNREDYEILVNSLPATGGRPTNPPDFAVKLLEDTCLASGLDWKMRHVYLMQRGGKWGVTLSIDGFRQIGSRDPDYAGQEGPFWVATSDGTWTDIPPDGAIYAAKVGIKHKSGITTWGVAKFRDYKAGPMWDKFPSTMSSKCAEMLAWRKAFPGRLGGLYGLEEMAQADKDVARKVAELAGANVNGVKAPASPASPASPVTEGDADAMKNGYLLRLKGAKSKDDLLAVGKEISLDKSLPLAVTLELHQEYTRLKGAGV
jgi:hypothetical protein